MDMPASQPPEPSIGDLFGRLADEGKAYVRAEADVYKAVAARRLANARSGAVALIAAALLMNAALGTLVICLALGLAPRFGPVLAGLIVFAAIALVSFFLVRFGASRMKALGGDAEERAALAASAERRP
jgi:hypothetical protein